MTVQYYPGYSQQQVQENLIVRTIASITQTDPIIVTTTEDHGYVRGMIVSFLIPSQFGMQQLNKLIGQVIDLTSNTITVNIDGLRFDAFSYPSPLPSAYTNPTVIPYSSGLYLEPLPLPYGNQDSFEGTIFNQGLP